MARKSRKNLQQPEQAATSVLLPELEEAKMPAAIYGRLSVEDEETEESMETQIALVQDYINRSRELSYVDTYFDNGFTGTNFKRPAFTRLMNDVRQKKIKCIVVKDLSRFGRNYLEAGYYIETVFPFLGIRLIAVTDNFDSTRTEDMESLALPIRNMVNAMYAKDMITLPLILAVWLAKWFVVFLHHCSAWIFYLLGSVLLVTAILSYLMQQSQRMEALQMLIGGFVIFMIPQLVSSVVVLLELAAVMLRQVWYI